MLENREVGLSVLKCKNNEKVFKEWTKLFLNSLKHAMPYNGIQQNIDAYYDILKIIMIP